MKKIIAKKDFVFNNQDFICGDEIKIDDINVIKKLNEQGFIEPLNFKDLVQIERNIKNKKTDFEEEVK